ncbi:MAG: 3-methyladenine DNA glycosylase [Chloroflexi bacterium]|nr:3-methyladenine DNA glycosylase [Chloroflexota bacterium]
MMILTISTPPHFRFWATVSSHGWCMLPPFDYDDGARTLSRVQQLRDGRVVRLTLSEAPGGLAIAVEGAAPSPDEQAEIIGAVNHMLNLDRDFSDFYAHISGHPRYGWIETVGAGRMLSSPTVWEDLTKTLLTTNTTWNMTIQMCRRLITLGDPYPAGGYAFPTPERLAAMNPDDLNAQVRAGYRGAYLHELANRIASGELDVESWRDPALPSADLYKRIKGLKGFGDYAAGSMLKLLGHFDRLATDTACRAVYRDRINGGNAAADDREIAAYYAPFGRWQGLVQWMDVMEDDLRHL